jgi:C1A family cysteine protease
VTSHDEEPGLFYLACLLVALVVAFLVAKLFLSPPRPRRTRRLPKPSVTLERPMRPYGWRPDLPDQRDYAFGVVHHPHLASLPAKVSLRDRMPAVFDQGELGSCTANALCAAFAYLHAGFVGSRLQVYYGERVLERSVKQDAGAAIRDGVKVLAKTGAAPEPDWPYVVAKFAKRPSAKAYRDAKAHKIAAYSRLTSGDDFRQCLAAGFPFVIGFTVYESFESDAVAASGVVPMPGKREQVLGGHAVCVIGYDATRADGPHYEVRNSWGADWGDAGNFWMPVAYLENSNLADDAWTLRA